MIRTSTMRNSVMFIVATVLAFGVETPATTVGQHADFLIQLGAIPLNGVEGRIDHFGFDAMHQRLFVGALGNDTVEVLDLSAGRLTQVCEFACLSVNHADISGAGQVHENSFTPRLQLEGLRMGF